MVQSKRKVKPKQGWLDQIKQGPVQFRSLRWKSGTGWRPQPHPVSLPQLNLALKNYTPGVGKRAGQLLLALQEQGISSTPIIHVKNKPTKQNKKALGCGGESVILVPARAGQPSLLRQFWAVGKPYGKEKRKQLEHRQSHKKYSPSPK